MLAFTSVTSSPSPKRTGNGCRLRTRFRPGQDKESKRPHLMEVNIRNVNKMSNKCMRELWMEIRAGAFEREETDRRQQRTPNDGSQRLASSGAEPFSGDGRGGGRDGDGSEGGMHIRCRFFLF